MLDMRPGCERCDLDLPADQYGALICSFECTFCTSFECTFCTTCNNNVFKGTCPNCSGVLMPRPTRTGAGLDNFPASTKRMYRPGK